jgi:hypothetical protein
MRRECLLLTAMVALVVGCPSAAEAAPRGSLEVTPAASIDTAPIRVHTSAGCPGRADGYYATARGHGFPADGQIVTTPTAAGMSHRAGFDVYFAQTMKDFAADNHTTLAGRYEVTVSCVETFTRTVFAEFAGSLTFVTPGTYRSGDVPAPSTATSAEPAAPAAGPFWYWIAAAVAAVLGAFETGRRLGRRSPRST